MKILVTGFDPFGDDKINPAMVIYEVNPIAFSNEGVESSLDFINNTDISVATAIMAFKVKDIRTINTLVYAGCRQLLHADAGFKTTMVKGNDKYISGGFVERKTAYFKHHQPYKPQANVVKDYQLACFKKSIADLLRSGIKVILVQAPITSALYKSYTNNEEFDSLMQIEKVPYYNFNTLVSLDDSLHFYDGHHLNQDGVVLFNKKLLEILKATSSATLK